MTQRLAIVPPGNLDLVVNEPTVFVDTSEWTDEDRQAARSYGGFLVDFHFDDPYQGAIALSPMPSNDVRYIACFDREVSTAQAWSTRYALACADPLCVGVAVSPAGLYPYDTIGALLPRLERLKRNAWRPLYVVQEYDVPQIDVPQWVFADCVDFRSINERDDVVTALLERNL